MQVKHRYRPVKGPPDGYLLGRGMELRTGGFVRWEETGSGSLRRIEGRVPASIRRKPSVGPLRVVRGERG